MQRQRVINYWTDLPSFERMKVPGIRPMSYDRKWDLLNEQEKKRIAEYMYLTKKKKKVTQ